MKYIEIIRDLQLDAKTEARLCAALQHAEDEKKERQRKGILLAKANGVKFGRPRATVLGIEQICKLYREKQITLANAAALSGVSRSTIYRRIREYTQI